MTRPALPRRDPRETLPEAELSEGERALLDWLADQIVRDAMRKTEEQCDEAA